jgi:hypothetical protein
VAIGNETDVFHSLNAAYVVTVLDEMSAVQIENPIVLVTKSPLSDKTMKRVRNIPGLRIVLFLSYSGLGRQFEPNFTDEQLRRNFSVAKTNAFPVVHYWRPLLPENTTPEAVEKMLSFASAIADATVFIGLKLHPELTRIITQGGGLMVPDQVRDRAGEWLESETVRSIYRDASRICPNYPLYRHASCALASVLRQPNHTATIYRQDICPPSHCPVPQRRTCEAARRIPTEGEIARVLSALPHGMDFERGSDRVILKGKVTQEEFAYLLHNLNCPIVVEAVGMQSLYHGSIYDGQRETN